MTKLAALFLKTPRTYFILSTDFVGPHDEPSVGRIPILCDEETHERWRKAHSNDDRTVQWEQIDDRYEVSTYFHGMPLDPTHPQCFCTHVYDLELYCYDESGLICSEWDDPLCSECFFASLHSPTWELALELHRWVVACLRDGQVERVMDHPRNITRPRRPRKRAVANN
jgi:hypothetical protein